MDESEERDEHAGVAAAELAFDVDLIWLVKAAAKLIAADAVWLASFAKPSKPSKSLQLLLRACTRVKVADEMSLALFWPPVWGEAASTPPDLLSDDACSSRTWLSIDSN